MNGSSGGPREGMSTRDVQRLVTLYIGGEGGYLADFSYRTHRDFYLYCNVDVDPDQYEGTTRQRFIQILATREPPDQARIVRGILERFSPGEGPPSRTEELATEFSRLADHLDGMVVSAAEPAFTSDVVGRAIRDAQRLLESNGATSGVDRVHTTLHGHLVAVCRAASLETPADSSITQVFKLLRREHPAFDDLWSTRPGHRAGTEFARVGARCAQPAAQSREHGAPERRATRARRSDACHQRCADGAALRRHEGWRHDVEACLRACTIAPVSRHLTKAATVSTVKGSSTDGRLPILDRSGMGRASRTHHMRESLRRAQGPGSCYSHGTSGTYDRVPPAPGVVPRGP